MTLSELELKASASDGSRQYEFWDRQGRRWIIYKRKMWVAYMLKPVTRCQVGGGYWYKTVSFTRKHTEDFLKTLEIYALME